MKFPQLMFNSNFSIILVASFLLLVPFGRLSNIPMAIMCLLGIWLLITNRIDLKHVKYKYFSWVFLCFFLPILCSFPDAVNKGNVLSVAAFYASYFFSGIYIIDVLFGNSTKQQLLLKICAYLLVFWIIDALFQVYWGQDLLGFHLQHNRLNGPFGERNPKLGIYLAALSPILFFYFTRAFHWGMWFIALLGTSSVVFLSGRRTGWVILVIVFLFFVLWQFFGEKRITFKWLIGGGVLFGFAIVSLYMFSPAAKLRVDRSAHIFSEDYNTINWGTGKRLPIWKTALRMIEAHPVNGVGARGFRYAYLDFADKDDPFINKKASLGAYQAHQLVLDVAANTGLIGLIGLVGSFYLLFLRWSKAAFREKEYMVPYALALIAVFFPINSHFATYSSQWSSFFFWLIALFFAHSGTDIAEGDSV